MFGKRVVCLDELQEYLSKYVTFTKYLNSNESEIEIVPYETNAETYKQQTPTKQIHQYFPEK